MSEEYILSAKDLASKWGFDDGDLLSGIAQVGKSHSLLIASVRAFLLPLLPDVEVYEIGTCHNPIRATDETRHLCEGSDVHVTLTRDQLLALDRIVHDH